MAVDQRAAAVPHLRPGDDEAERAGGVYDKAGLGGRAELSAFLLQC